MVRRKQRSSSNRSGGSGLGMLVVGMVIGSILTAIIIGMRQDPNAGIGSGINQLIEKNEARKINQQSGVAQTQEGDKKQPLAPNPSYDYYDLLPEIERVIPEDYKEPDPKVVAEKKPADASISQPVTRQKHFVLQAASFGRTEEAEKLKAQLALAGHQSYIQKVTIEGKKYFRVRLGPFKELDRLNKANDDLVKQGLRPAKLEVTDTPQ